MKRISWMLLLTLGLVACFGNAPSANPCLTTLTPARSYAQHLCDPDPVFGPSQEGDESH